MQARAERVCRQKTVSKVKQDEESGRVGNKRAGGAGIGSKAGRRERTESVVAEASCPGD